MWKEAAVAYKNILASYLALDRNKATTKSG
jgi:hypothetical protein